MNHWWMWMVLGVVLTAMELLTPGGFFIIFFAIAALVIGVLDLAGVVERAWVEWFLFSLVALVALRLFRRPLLARLQTGTRADVDSLVGEMAIATAHMGTGDYGRVELRGSIWNARNVGGSPLAAGARGRVVAVEGLMLDVVAA